MQIVMMMSKAKTEKYMARVRENTPWEMLEVRGPADFELRDMAGDELSMGEAQVAIAAPDMLQLIVDIAQGAQFGDVAERLEAVLRAALPGDVADEVLGHE